MTPHPRFAHLLPASGEKGNDGSLLCVVAAAFLLLLTGCGFFSRAKSTFYSLEPLPGTTAAITGAPIAIDGIELPPGLDRREIVVRGASGKLEVRERNQWASPLEDMVIHTLAFNIAKRVPEGMVILPGQAKPAGPVRSIYIVFEDLTAGPESTFTLDARWTSAQRTRHETITVPLQSLASESIVGGMNEALSILAQRIVDSGG